MSTPIAFVPSLALGLTLILAIGTLGIVLLRAPQLRHRWVQLSLFGSIVTGVLLAAPMQRPLAPGANASGMRELPSLVLSGEALAEQAASNGVAAAAGQAAPIPQLQNVQTGWSLGMLWLIGAATVGLLLLAACAALLRTVRRAQPVPAEVLALLPSGAPLPRIVHSPSIQRPLCCGHQPGWILLPSDLLRPERRTQLQAVLLHEHAHLAMGHGLARGIAALAAPLLFWNPLYWLHCRVLRDQAELLADDAAAHALGRHSYATELLALAQSQASSRPPRGWRLSPGIGVFSEPEPFYARMRSLLLRDRPLATRCTASQRCGILLISLLSMSAIACTMGRTPNPSGEQRSKAQDLGDLARQVRELDQAHGNPMRMRADLNEQGGYDVVLNLKNSKN